MSTIKGQGPFDVRHRDRRDVIPRKQFNISLDIDAHVSATQQSDERAVDGVASGAIGLGEGVTWRARHFRIWLTMTVNIAN